MKNRKEKILKVILYLTFFPYAILLLLGIYHAIFGYQDCGIFGGNCSTLLGLKAFRTSIVWNFLGFCFVPIIPICVLYDIIYIVVGLIKKSITYRLLYKISFISYLIIFLCMVVLGFDIIFSLPCVIILGLLIPFHIINGILFLVKR